MASPAPITRRQEPSTFDGNWPRPSGTLPWASRAPFRVFSWWLQSEHWPLPQSHRPWNHMDGQSQGCMYRTSRLSQHKWPAFRNGEVGWRSRGCHHGGDESLTGAREASVAGWCPRGPVRQRPLLLSEPGAPASPSPSAPVPAGSGIVAPDATAAASAHRQQCPLLHRQGAVL